METMESDLPGRQWSDERISFSQVNVTTNPSTRRIAPTVVPASNTRSTPEPPGTVTRPAKSLDATNDEEPPFQDLWQHKRINWINVAVSIATYSLIVSDVPRAGAQVNLNMRRIGMGVYSIFGSYAYGVMTFSRDASNWTNLTATNGYVPVDSVRTWSYMYDTTSSGLRTVTRLFNESTFGDNLALRCMNYELQCDPTGSMTLPDTFEVLDQVIDAVHAIPEEALPEILPRPPENESWYQHTRQASLVKRRHTDILYDYLSYPLVDSIEISSFRITHFPNIEATFDPCAQFRDRPYLCDAGPISDYRQTADPMDPGSVSVERISKAVRKQALATLDMFHNRSDNIQVDVTFFEGFSHPMTFTGGLIVSAMGDFEIVKLVRVRDCSSTLSQCKTIHLEDFRFEGARAITDVADWNTLLVFLRVLGQTLFIVRVLALFAGCYFAFPPGRRSLHRTIFLAFSEVPSHVIAYGSSLPIMLYTTAMWIDGPVTNLLVQYGGIRLQGTSIQNPGGIYTLICILMRRQWLMATLAMVWLKVQTLSNHWDRHRGTLSMRGHIFSVLSTMSMAFGYHHPRFRDSRILEVTDENPDIAVLNIGVYTRDLTIQKLSGVFSDLIAMMFCGVVYIVIVLVLRTLIRFCCLCALRRKQVKGGHRHSSSQATGSNMTSTRLRNSNSALHVNRDVRGTNPVTRMSKTSSCGTQIAHPQTRPARSRRPLRSTVAGVLFCRSEPLPSTCGTLWSHLGLVCGWDEDILLAVVGKDLASIKNYEASTVVLMNVVQLTEPINYLLIRYGFVSAEVRVYRDCDTKATFSCVNEQLDPHTTVVGDERVHPTGKPSWELVETKLVQDLPFHKLVQCW